MLPSLESQKFSLKNFEGSLNFLLHLVQKSEIPISDIPLHQLIHQYITSIQTDFSPNLNEGADFISHTASLILLKSKHLLPIRDDEEPPPSFEEESPFQILPKLLEYCRFKEVSKTLASLEQDQQCFYLRGLDPFYTPDKKLAGIDRISLEQLHEMFRKVLEKASERTGVIQEEIWRVKDKMVLFRQMLQTEEKIALKMIFSPSSSKLELIVSFLALLELIKLEELMILQEEELFFSRRQK